MPEVKATWWALKVCQPQRLAPSKSRRHLPSGLMVISTGECMIESSLAKALDTWMSSCLNGTSTKDTLRYLPGRVIALIRLIRPRRPSSMTSPENFS
ncbi:hypothetical protein D9M69_628530 [compost metagenome]